jgi:hypothetical protein
MMILSMSLFCVLSRVTAENRVSHMSQRSPVRVVV